MGIEKPGASPAALGDPPDAYPPMNFITVSSPLKPDLCFVRQGAGEQRTEPGQGLRAGQAQHGAHVMVAGVGKAAVQMAVGGKPQPGAGAAERCAQVGAEAEDTPARRLEAHRGGVPGRVGAGVLTALPDEGQDVVHAEEFPIELVAVAQMPHVHQLDEAQLDAPREAVVQHRQDLVRVAAHRHHVDLHLEAGIQHPSDARPHGGQVAAAGDGAEGGGVQGVQADVDAAQPGGDDPIGLPRQQLAVGGDADVFQGQRHEGRQKLVELRRHQRLAARDVQLLDAGGLDQQLHSAAHLIGAEFVRRRL